MVGKLYAAFVLACWAATMTWLYCTKIHPTLSITEPPAAAASLPQPGEPTVRSCWEIRWQSRSIGRADSRAVRYRTGGGEMTSVVRLEQLPAQAIIRQLLGPMSRLVEPLTGRTAGKDIDLTVSTKIVFDARDHLSELSMRCDLNHIPEFLVVRGRAEEGKLHLVATTTLGMDGRKQAREIYRESVDYEADRLRIGALSPVLEMTDLYVGKSWTFPIYRPFPPGNPPQVVAAEVERYEQFEYQGHARPTFVVAIRPDAGTGIVAVGQPETRLWVDEQGQVLQQQLNLSSLRFLFVRIACPEIDEPPGKFRPAS